MHTFTWTYRDTGRIVWISISQAYPSILISRNYVSVYLQYLSLLMAGSVISSSLQSSEGIFDVEKNPRGKCIGSSSTLNYTQLLSFDHTQLLVFTIDHDRLDSCPTP